jgi:hypothetical protein
MTSKYHRLIFAGVIATGIGLAVVGTSHAKGKTTKDVLALPVDFRASMVHLGSWFVPKGDASGFHDVYADRAAVNAFRKRGKWPDGAKIVKELRSSEAGTYTTGVGVQRATDSVKQWFVMVKDSKGKNKGPLWGSGWGWALYKPDRPTVNVAKNYRSDCLGCHIPAKSTDYIYIDAYPTLRAPAR